MIIKKLAIWHLRLRFQSPIKHNLATHVGSDNVIVRVTTADSITGFGEGVPRTFVTGEDLSGSLAFFQNVLAAELLEKKFSSFQELLPTLEDLFKQTQAHQHPSAFCALETALLDAAGQNWGVPVSELVGPKLRDSVRYSAVIPIMSPAQMEQLFNLIKLNNMHFIKLKVGTDTDIETLKMARQHLGYEVDLRVDANSAWSPSEAIERLKEMEPYQVAAVEQPVAKDDFAGLKQVQEALQIPVIADESLCTEDDAHQLIDLRACKVFNIRLSKCGGLGAARRILRMAQEAGISCQLGCHVGETSILSAAGRHFALSIPRLTYLEGSFAPYLLDKDVVAQPVIFKNGGMASELTGSGLGIEVLEEVLSELAVSFHEKIVHY